MTRVKVVCPACGGKFKTIRTIATGLGWRRRRECQACGRRFTSFETIVSGVAS